MPFRPCVLWSIVFVAVFLSEDAAAQIQVPRDFTAWKDVRNAEAVPGWASGMLRRDFSGVTGTDREKLLAKNLSALKNIAADADVVPSTRYNAILAAGQLVSVEPSPGNLPVAYPIALTYLIEVYQEPTSPHYLQYGALLGIVRHTNSVIDPVQRNTVIDLLLKTATTEFEAGEITLDSVPLEPATWDWFRQTALDGLTALKTVGTNGKVVTELLAVINHQSQELEELTDTLDMLTRDEWERSRRVTELASKTAKTLGDFVYTSETNIDAKKMTDAFIRLTKAVCDINGKMATDFIEQGKTSLNSAILRERITINVKMCTQSVGWGIRGGFLPVNPAVKPAENSFYASLAPDDSAVRRLDILLVEIIGLAAFLDEGDGTKRPVLSANLPKEFQFDLPALRDALVKISEILTKIQREEDGKP